LRAQLFQARDLSVLALVDGTRDPIRLVVVARLAMLLRDELFTLGGLASPRREGCDDDQGRGGK